jgi:hypothetical protein
MVSYLLDRLRDFGKKRPNKQGLQARMAEALDQSPLAPDSAAAPTEPAA